MNQENTVAWLASWQKQHEAVEKLMSDVESSIGLNIDGPLFDVVWKLFDAYTKTVSAQVGDDFGWMEWYQSENDMGARCFEACPGAGCKLRKVKTLKDLARLIVESRK